MHEGKFSLVRLFTQLAMVGAEWVMWVLVALSVFSIAIMLERGRFYWSLSDDLEALAKDLRDLLRRDDSAGARVRLEKSNSPAVAKARPRQPLVRSPAERPCAAEWERRRR